MLSQLNIPKKINIGFQKRQDTYTGKLAYVIYTDQKGVLRKEKSWNTWRDKKIEPKEFENVPTSGFVLNKKVGDYKSDWNHRQAWIRIYDPRDFEFEISVENLLFILQETSAIKGKGLDGEFVYAWDGADLVLLPASSQEYQSSAEFTDLQTKKISQKEMREGCLYRNKDQKEVMYLGRHDWYDFTTNYTDGGTTKLLKHSKLHIFVSVDGESDYWTQKGFTNLAQKLSEEPSPLFADEYEKFKNSEHASEPEAIIDKPYDMFAAKDHYGYCYVRENGLFYNISFSPEYGKSTYYSVRNEHPVSITKNIELITRHNTSEPQYGYDYRNGYQRIQTGGFNGRTEGLTKADIKKLDLCQLFLQNKKGTLIKL